MCIRDRVSVDEYMHTIRTLSQNIIRTSPYNDTGPFFSDLKYHLPLSRIQIIIQGNACAVPSHKSIGKYTFCR